MPEKRDAEERFLGKLILGTRQRIRYYRALHELQRLDDRDLDDLDIARVDFPELAWRHAIGAESLDCINLRSELVTPVAQALRALGVSFVLASAYNQLDLGAALLAKAPNAGKPTSEWRLLAMLGKAVGS